MTDHLDPLQADDGPCAPLKAFLVARGVARHKQTAEVAGLLGLAKTSVFRKFKGESTFSLAELKVIADHFGTDVATLRGQAGSASGDSVRAAQGEPATLLLGDLSLPALLVPGPELAADDICDLVAVQLAGHWKVLPFGHVELHGQQLHSIANLNLAVQPRQRVALLEDDAAAADVVSMALQAQGMVVHVYRDPEALIAAAASRPYQAYVVDWLLGNGTAEEAIRQVRLRQAQVPIAITTGALNTGAETEGSLIPFAEQAGAGIFEKPFRHAVLASFLRRNAQTPR